MDSGVKGKIQMPSFSSKVCKGEENDAADESF